MHPHSPNAITTLSSTEASPTSIHPSNIWHRNKNATHPFNPIAITTSSKEALPARSPMPLMVHSICRAPAMAPARLLAVAKPKSFCAWRQGTTSYTFATFVICAHNMCDLNIGVAHENQGSSARVHRYCMHSAKGVLRSTKR